MPSATNLVIKDAAAVDRTFTLYSPSAGDSSLATWKYKKGDVPTAYPTITAMAAPTAAKSRKLTLKLRDPASHLDPATGLVKVVGFAELNVTVSVPDEFPDSKRDDFVAFIANAFSHVLVKAMLRDALPAV